MNKGFLITGTDTGVGKTYVAAGIAAELKKRKSSVGVMKPAETGCRAVAGRLVPKDALRLMKAAGARDSLALVNPCRFRKPLAPSIAAELEGSSVNISAIMKAFRTLSSRHELMIVEGAGGILVPLTGKHTYLDLAGQMGLPVVIVARPGLGTINHTLLTIAVLKERGMKIAGVVINYAQSQKRGLAEKTGPMVIEKMSGIPIVEIISYASRDFGSLADRLMGDPPHLKQGVAFS
ncbi:MAG TPA: dethiobiotin synthase [Nitrospirota bacterium]